ncbi:MAG: sensor domain-containing diguanylate cyclase [Clostridium sp.]
MEVNISILRVKDKGVAMVKYNIEYEKLKMQFEEYKNLSEDTILELTNENKQLEKSLDALTNIVQVSNYVNSFLSSENLMPRINDMVVGILGVQYCTIYILEKGEWIIKATNVSDENNILSQECKINMEKRITFIINSNNRESIYVDKKHKGEEIYSRMGVPIKIRDNFIGYIIVDHTHNQCFTEENEKFVKAISNQIAIAIENSILYNEIKNATKYDPLIGIYNRKTFFEIIDKKIKEDKEKKYAIIMIDLDNFKRVNDTLGHQFGDSVLIETGKLISDKLILGDIIARYGGEEIIVYINEADDENDVFRRMEVIRKAIEFNVIRKENITKHITASFGVSFYPHDGDNIAEIIKSADKLLYKAKYSGKNKVLSSHLYR